MNRFDVNDERHFRNEYPDYSIETAANYITSSNVNASFEKFLINKILEFTTILDGEILKISSKDVSIYTGLSGISYFYYNLSNSNVDNLSSVSKRSMKAATSLIERSLRHLRGKSGSFICDDTGPLTMAVLLNVDSSKFNDIINMLQYVVKSEQLPNEMLYGRSGYLFALLLLNKHGKNVPSEIIKKVFQSIIKSGQALSLTKQKDIKDSPPLFYEWHDKPYLGAAHGMAGIMFMLLQVYLEPSLHEFHSEIKHEIFEYVSPTIKYLSKCRLPSGNYPSSLGESARRDVLVHWCHGAPGWIHMFIAAHKVFKEEVYMERVTEIAEVIWNRGLLHKGCGLCHGSAGNGYAFLAIYKYTENPLYLYRALKFAEWCTDSSNKTREADRPYSLFEGLAGTINFLVDCLDPKNAKFPAFEL